MRQVIRIALGVLVGLPLVSLLFFFPSGAGARAQAPVKKSWEGPPPV